MAKKFYGTFTRRFPDVITEELAVVLSGKKSFEFKPLFDIIHANLLARKHVGGGEEMMRLKAYEKLQNLVGRGMVDKTITKGVKKYRGLTALASALPVVPIVIPVIM